MSCGSNNYSKNLITRTVTLTGTTWTLAEPFRKDRVKLILRNAGSEDVELNTNVKGGLVLDDTQNDPLKAAPNIEPADTAVFTLRANEVLTFDTGEAPFIVWARGTTAGSTLEIITG